MMPRGIIGEAVMFMANIGIQIVFGNIDADIKFMRFCLLDFAIDFAGILFHSDLLLKYELIIRDDTFNYSRLE